MTVERVRFEITIGVWFALRGLRMLISRGTATTTMMMVVVMERCRTRGSVRAA